MCAERVEIRVPVEELNYSESGSIDGLIWLQAPELDFPTAGWFDFPLVLLAWWAEESLRVTTPGTRGITLRFMDGVCCARLESLGPEKWVLRCYPREGAGHAHEVPCDPVALQNEIRRCAVVVLQWCEQRGWSGRDVRELRTALSYLPAG